MVRRKFELPDVGEGVAEGELLAWFVESGDQIDEDKPIAEIETDKATVEIPSPYQGMVAELRAEEGEIIPVGKVIVVFEVDEEDVDSIADTSSKADTELSSDNGSTETSDANTANTDTSMQTKLPEGHIFASPSVRRLARETGIDLAELQSADPRTRIDERTVIRAASDSGVADATSSIGVGKSSGGAQPEATSSNNGAESNTLSVDEASQGRMLAMPATRQLAREEGINIDSVPASEEFDGRPFVTPEDVQTFAADETIAASSTLSATSDTKSGQGSVEAADDDGPQPGQTVPYRGVRRSIGDKMTTSKFTAPHVSHHDEVEVSNLVDARSQMKAIAEESSINLTYMPFVVKAVVAALKSMPQINAELDEEAEEIRLKDEYNIGIAVASDAGLMVPVIDDADQKGLLELAEEINDKAVRARDRTIQLEEMQGGTFTITNVGAIGGEYASPIINYPEAGILAIGSLKERPWVKDGEVVARSTMPISMSVDHRIVDGADVAQFTNEVKRYLNKPKLLLLE